DRRAALHLAIAGLFESATGLDEDRRIAALAHHHARALPLGDAPKALDYIQRAAAQAKLRYAYEVARDYLEQALRIAEINNVADAETLFSILLDLGEVLAQGGQRDLARTTFNRAIDHARRVGISDGAARVALRLTAGIALNDQMFFPDERLVLLLREA